MGCPEIALAECGGCSRGSAVPAGPPPCAPTLCPPPCALHPVPSTPLSPTLRPPEPQNPLFLVQSENLGDWQWHKPPRLQTCGSWGAPGGRGVRVKGRRTRGGGGLSPGLPAVGMMSQVSPPKRRGGSGWTPGDVAPGCPGWANIPEPPSRSRGSRCPLGLRPFPSLPRPFSSLPPLPIPPQTLPSPSSSPPIPSHPFSSLPSLPKPSQSLPILSQFHPHPSHPF